MLASQRMQEPPNGKLNRLLILLPVVLGCGGLLLCAIYEAQRTGMLVSTPFNHFLRVHRVSIGQAALFFSVMGMLVGTMAMRLVEGHVRVVVLGTISAIAAVIVSLCLTL